MSLVFKTGGREACSTFRRFAIFSPLMFKSNDGENFCGGFWETKAECAFIYCLAFSVGQEDSVGRWCAGNVQLRVMVRLSLRQEVFCGATARARMVRLDRDAYRDKDRFFLSQYFQDEETFLALALYTACTSSSLTLATLCNQTSPFHSSRPPPPPFP